MMRVDKAKAPKGFVAKVTKPGNLFLSQNPMAHADDLPTYWVEFRESLYDKYHGICAYTGIHIVRAHGYDMDHIRPKGIVKYRHLAYSWGNFCLTTPGINRKKWMHIVADPFSIPLDAVLMSQINGQVYPSQSLSPKDYALVDETINKLGLNENALPDERIDAYTAYLASQMQIGHLATKFPYVAYEMLRLGKIRPGDCATCKEILHGLGFSGSPGSVPRVKADGKSNVAK